MKTAIVSALIGLVFASPLSADPWTSLDPPVGLGESFHWVFASSSAMTATATSISDYDSFVQGLADAANIGSGSSLGFGDITWKAIGSTELTDAIDHAAILGPVFRLDGVKDADEGSFWSSTHLAPISVSEVGGDPFRSSVRTETAVWTGTQRTGFARDMAQLGTISPAFGLWDATDIDGWINYADDPGFYEYSVYAISEPLKVVPVPSGVVLIKCCK